MTSLLTWRWPESPSPLAAFGGRSHDTHAHSWLACWSQGAQPT